MDFSHLTNSQLKQSCRALGLPSRRLSRQHLILSLQQLVLPQSHPRKALMSTPNIELCVRKIQSWWRARTQRRLLIANDTDFVTLEPIAVRPFYLIEETRHIYQFHPVNLAHYFLKEGNFSNPYTRKPLNAVELRRLDRVVHQYDPSFVSLCDEQRRITIQRAQEREHVRVCQWLHTECLQLIQQVIHFIQTQHTQPNRRPISLDIMMFRIVNDMLPQFFNTFRQLFMLDQAFACDSICYIFQKFTALWHDASIVNTREACYLVESIVSTLHQFISSVVPVLPALLPEFHQMQELVR